jgi:hypothetical protein
MVPVFRKECWIQRLGLTMPVERRRLGGVRFGDAELCMLGLRLRMLLIRA